jgi:hypothetical protein
MVQKGELINSLVLKIRQPVNHDQKKRLHFAKYKMETFLFVNSGKKINPAIQVHTRRCRQCHQR